jgi:hypothetical protein
MKGHYLLMFVALTCRLTAQREALQEDTLQWFYAGHSRIKFEALGKVSLYLTDGTIKIHAVWISLHADHIVYRKGGVLHDLMIDRIIFIETEDNGVRIRFNERNKPMING